MSADVGVNYPNQNEVWNISLYYRFTRATAPKEEAKVRAKRWRSRLTNRLCQPWGWNNTTRHWAAMSAGLNGIDQILKEASCERNDAGFMIQNRLKLCCVVPAG